MHRLLPRHPLSLAFAALTAFAGAGALPLAVARQESPAADPDDLAPADVQNALLDGDWKRALAELAVADQANPAARDLHQLLRGQLEMARRDAVAAERAYALLERDFPASRWLAKARFGRAEALRDLRRFAEAEAIVAGEVARLRAGSRRDELLTPLLALADRALDPGSERSAERTPADPARALALYDQLLTLDPPAALAARIERQRGRALQRLNQQGPAIDAFRAWLRHESGRPLAQETIDVRLALAECQVAARGGPEARRTLEALATEVAANPEPTLHARLGDVLLATARTFSRDHERLLAAAALRRFLERAPAHPQRMDARLELSQLLADSGRSDEALVALSELAAEPGVDEKALRSRAEAAYRTGRLLLAAGRCAEAQAAFADAIARDPGGPRWAEAQSGIVESEYAVATFASAAGDHAGARTALEQWILRHPLDPRVAPSRVRLGDLWLQQAEARRKSGEDATATAALDRSAIDAWQAVVRAAPGSEAASEALFKVGARWNELGDVEQAVVAWRACDFGPFAGHAAARLALLLTPSLSVTTPRSFRAAESVALDLATRNVPELTVKLHRLDLEAYFRKFLAADGVDRLDLDLIAPDATSTFKIPEFARWKEFAGPLPLALAGSGAWIAVVESEVARATTLVLKSDLDLIVKSSHRELLVYVEDRAGGTPAAGVEVSCDIGAGADGSRRLLSGTTSADGTFHARSETPFQSDAVRVFARRGDDVAVVNVPLDGVSLPPPALPRALLFTDRPACRPGESIAAVAFLRDARDGQLALPERAGWTMALQDPRGREVAREPLGVDEFGTASARFTLDALAPTGDWVVLVTRPDGPAFRASFVVADYELERVKLDLELPRRVWFRGETIPLVATARWQHGAPVVDAPIRFALPDGRLIDVATDAEGRARVEFATIDLHDEQPIAFAATLLDGGISAQAAALLATREFDLALTVPDRALLPGERFAVTATATGRDGTPRSPKVEFALLFRVDGGGERLIETRAADAGADGRARLETALEKGGRHVVRATAVDRFGQPIAVEATLWISDRDDAQRLRLLADRTTLRAGETARVRLVQRGPGGRVLLTWERADAVRWQVTQVTEEVTTLEVAAEAELAPGFVLAAAALRGTALQSDAIQFGVTRALELVVAPESGSAKPGEEVTVRVEARDPLGQPVAARIALSVVDDALLRRFDDLTLDPATVFAPPSGVLAPWRNGSSAGFRYVSAVRSISSEVLAEQRREDAQQQLEANAVALLGQLGYMGGDDGGAAGAEGSAFAHQSAEPDDRRNALTRADALDAAKDKSSGPGGGGGARGGLGRLRNGAPGRPPTAGGAVEPQLPIEGETAFFAPDLVTGSDGKARVTFRLPETATTWRLVARGITADHRAGAAQATLLARAPFHVELRLASQFLEGDQPRLLATLFRADELAGVVELRLRAKLGDQVISLPATVDLAAATTAEHLFAALPPLPLVEAVSLELTATLAARDGPREARFAARVPVEPWGLEQLAARSGELAGRTAFTLDLPADSTFIDRRFHLLLAPSAPRLLLDEALDRTRDVRKSALLAGQDEAALELLSGCEVLQLGQRLVEAAQATALDLALLRRRAAAQLARLIVAQQDDGGWPWTGGRGSDRSTSALALVALARASAIGFEVPVTAIARGLAYVEKEFRAAGPEADEQKALLQLALARHDRADAAALQRLHRVRASLSTAGLAFACLALDAAKRGPMATELAALLEERSQPALSGGDGCRWDAGANGRFHRSSLETAAWSVMALAAARPQSPVLAQGVAALLSARPWQPERAAGLARAALARWYSEQAAERVEGAVRIRVGARELTEVKLVPGAGVLRIDVPADLVTSSSVRVELDVSGRARPSYVALLSGFTTNVARRDQADLRIRSVDLLAPAPLLRGRPLAVGFGALTEPPRDAWVNRVTELPVGEACEIEVNAWLGQGSSDAGDNDPFNLSVPLPAGVELLAGTVEGEHAAFAQRPDGLEFRLLRRQGFARLRFTVVGRLPGEWRILPPEIRSTVELERAATGDPWTFRVLPRGAKPSDVHRATPDELLDRGRRLKQAGDLAGAAVPLEELVARFGARLTEPVQREVARTLLDAALPSGDATRIVRQFEIVKEKDPDLGLPGEAVRQVAAAYRSLEEPEPALELWRALLAETFARDLRVPALLIGEKRRKEGFLLSERLWLEHPDLPAAKQAWLSTSDEMLALAPRAHEDASLRAEGLTGSFLRREGMRVLSRFLSHSPSDPLAPEAGLSLVAAWLTLGSWEQAATLAERLAKRFPEPRFADSYLYSRAVAEWALGRDDVARELLERIAAAEYVDAAGRKSPSQNRELAWHILGQIHHARRDGDAAARFYEKVAASVPDAREALRSLRERRLELPEVTLARLGGKVALAITAKNLARAELKVYPVDLMTLCLRQRNLDRVAGVELAGIAPVASLAVELDPAATIEPRKSQVELSLPTAGAYLVLARADEHHASGLVLVSPLELQVREEEDGGRVRVHVQEAASGKFVRDVDVRIIGSDDVAFVAGKTDARGLFVAEGLDGAATIIARHGDRDYAFWRGTRRLAGDATRSQKPGQSWKQQDAAANPQDAYLKNVMELNRGLQQQRREQVGEQLENAGKEIRVNSRD